MHWFQEQGVLVVAYHAGLSQQDRSRAQERFLNEEGIIVVATVAFSMGIDKPNVRFVAHLDLPNSLEGYYQETGRAGRDGLPSTAWMVYGLQDVVNVRRMLADSDAPEEVKRMDAGKLNALLTYCETATCRRQVLLGYFGDAYSGPCGNCDVCLNPPTMRDMTREAQMALSAAIRTDNRFGAGYLTDILLGKETDKNRRHRTLPTYGIGRHHDAKVWGSVLRQLVSLGYLTAGPFHGLMTTPQARRILTGEQALLLREDTLLPRAAKRSREKAQAARVVIGPEDRPLFLALRTWRSERATELKIPPYVFFSDASLKAIAEARPGNMQSLGKISGIGERRLAEYGAEVLRIVDAGCTRRNPGPGELGLAPAPRSVGSPVPSRMPTLTPPSVIMQGSLSSAGRLPRSIRPASTPAVLPEPPGIPVEAPVPLMTRDIQDEAPFVQGAAEVEEAQPHAAVAVALSALRRELARETGYAAYVVFPNASLTALVARLPRTMSELVGIPGLGPKRIETYGDRILNAIATGLEVFSAAESAVHASPTTLEAAGHHQLPALLEQIANELRSGRYQLGPVSPEKVLRDVSPEGNGTEFQGWHYQEKDGVMPLILQMKREE